MSTPRVRLADVAERSDVTKSVVSRVLNDDATLRVRPETRERILAVAAELGYRPHAGARALSTSQTGALALLVPDVSNSVYAAVVRGAYRRARDLGYVLLLAEDADDDGVEVDYAELVLSGRVDGLMVASAHPGHPLVDRLLAEPERVAHVFVNREVAGSDRNIGLDMEGASAGAVDHLVAYGHSMIGIVSGPPELSPAVARLTGFRGGMVAAGLAPDRVVDGEFTEHGGYVAALALIQRHPDTTAIYASTFGQAVGVMRACRELELRVPDDVSLIAYDDLPMADYLTPRLTTLAMPMALLGAAAVDALVEQVSTGTATGRRVGGGFKIISRDSVASPRGSS